MKCLYILLFNILATSLVFCSETSANKSKVINSTLSETLVPYETKVPIEGGSISPDKLIMSVPTSNNDIPALGSEIRKSKIHPRKGAFEDVTKAPEKPLNNPNTSTTKPDTPQQLQITKEHPIVLNSSTTPITLLLPKINSTAIDNTAEVTSKPVQLPKKPQILNADLLENSPPEVKSSPGPVHSQLQSPNSDVKSYLSSANTHPGMVMPIVITILLVPMFAVLGYMALRRGQEAWKNRHYKRMDFLLDGMYND